jgi:hypothetical protein
VGFGFWGSEFVCGTRIWMNVRFEKSEGVVGEALRTRSRMFFGWVLGFGFEVLQLCVG